MGYLNFAGDMFLFAAASALAFRWLELLDVTKNRNRHAESRGILNLPGARTVVVAQVVFITSALVLTFEISLPTATFILVVMWWSLSLLYLTGLVRIRAALELTAPMAPRSLAPSGSTPAAPASPATPTPCATTSAPGRTDGKLGVTNALHRLATTVVYMLVMMFLLGALDAVYGCLQAFGLAVFEHTADFNPVLVWITFISFVLNLGVATSLVAFTLGWKRPARCEIPLYCVVARTPVKQQQLAISSGKSHRVDPREPAAASSSH